MKVSLIGKDDLKKIVIVFKLLRTKIQWSNGFSSVFEREKFNTDASPNPFSKCARLLFVQIPILENVTRGLKTRKYFLQYSMFAVVEVFFKQKDKTSKDPKNVIPSVQRGHHTNAVIVWWGVSCNKAVKTGTKV